MQQFITIYYWFGKNVNFLYYVIDLFRKLTTLLVDSFPVRQKQVVESNTLENTLSFQIHEL